MHQLRHTVLLFALAASVGVSAQGRAAADQQDREAADRITALSSHLQFDSDDPEATSRLAELGSWTERLVDEVDHYIRSAIRADEGSQRIQARLRSVLASNAPEPEHADLPLAQIADLSGGQSLAVAYTVVRGPHHDWSTIRGYHWDADRFQLVATTGDDFGKYNATGEFEGYSMFKAVLPSPLKNELWLLAWGQAHTFNGKRVRVRVYAFDGEKFTTAWKPEDVFNADVHVTGSGFVIDHELLTATAYQKMHDVYVLTADGPIKTN